MAPVVRLGSIPDKRKKLLDQVRDVIRRKHFSIRTEQAYTDLDSPVHFVPRETASARNGRGGSGRFSHAYGAGSDPPGS
jgi:hypothetical protein